MKRKRQFPDCAADCELVKLLGVGECENACPEKFAERSGNPKEEEKGGTMKRKRWTWTHNGFHGRLTCQSD